MKTIDQLYEYLKTTKRFVDSHDVHTPRALVEEILDHIDLVDKSILVLFNLEFVVSLVYNKHIDPACITLYADHENKVKLAEKIGVKYITSLDTDMKFDVVIGNPPYQKSNATAKRWTLWEEFVKKAMTLSSTVAMITPQSITSPSIFKLIKDHCTTISVDVTHHFKDIGSTFCYWIVDTTRIVNNTTIITDHRKYTVDLTGAEFLPITINDETLALMDTLVKRNSRIWKRGELHTSNKLLFSEDGKYSVIHTNAQVLKSNAEHINRTKIRVAVTLSGYPKFQIVTNGYVSQACFWTECTDFDEAQEFANDCNGEEIQKMLSLFKWSGWNSKEVIKCL